MPLLPQGFFFCTCFRRRGLGWESAITKTRKGRRPETRQRSFRLSSISGFRDSGPRSGFGHWGLYKKKPRKCRVSTEFMNPARQKEGPTTKLRDSRVSPGCHLDIMGTAPNLESVGSKHFDKHAHRRASNTNGPKAAAFICIQIIPHRVTSSKLDVAGGGVPYQCVN